MKLYCSKCGEDTDHETTAHIKSCTVCGEVHMLSDSEKQFIKSVAEDLDVDRARQPEFVGEKF